MVHINQYTMKKYTDEELNFIKSNYQTMSNKKIGMQINRSQKTIKDKLKNLGLKRTKEQALRIISCSQKNRQCIKYSKLTKSWIPFVTVNGKRMQKSHYVWGAPIPKGFVIHHKDLNPHNNEKDNLQLMSKADHNKFHTSLKGIYGIVKRGGKI